MIYTLSPLFFPAALWLYLRLTRPKPGPIKVTYRDGHITGLDENE